MSLNSYENSTVFSYDKTTMKIPQVGLKIKILSIASKSYSVKAKIKSTACRSKNLTLF